MADGTAYMWGVKKNEIGSTPTRPQLIYIYSVSIIILKIFHLIFHFVPILLRIMSSFVQEIHLQ